MSLTDLYTCNYYHNQDIEHFHHVKRFPVAPAFFIFIFFAVNLSLQSWLQATADVLFNDRDGSERKNMFYPNRKDPVEKKNRSCRSL